MSLRGVAGVAGVAGFAGDRAAAVSGRETLLRTADLVRRFGDEVAVDGVDVAVEPGDIHALVGLNGAGKTTLMRLMLGMLRPDRGSAYVRGTRHEVDVQRAAPRDWVAVGHLIERPFTYAELTVGETVRAVARLRGLNGAAADAAAAAMIDELALRRWRDRRTSTLSAGNRQRVGLACALVHRPRVLVLDEPTNALDPAGVVVVRRLLLAAAEHGAGILVSSHHLDEMARMATRITVMHRGTLVGELPRAGTDLERQFFDMVYAAEGVAGRDPHQSTRSG